MAKNIKAIYRNGVFKPLTKVQLKDKQKVKLTVIGGKKQTKLATSRPMRPRGATSHRAYGIVGLFKSGHHDLSKNHDKHLYA